MTAIDEFAATLLEEAKRSGIVAAIVIDGSYVTKKQEPEDIDVIIVLRTDFDLGQPLRPFEAAGCILGMGAAWTQRVMSILPIASKT